MPGATVTYVFDAQTGRFQQSLAQAGASVDTLGKKLDGTAKPRRNLTEGLSRVGNAAGKMALGLGLGIAYAVKKAADFDKSMSKVKAATHETAANMQSLRDAAIQAGAKTAFSATEAAAGIENLAKAGVSTKAILAGGLSGALDLAAAGEMQVADAAEAAASAMTQFSLKGKDVPHIADLLAAAAGKAQGEVSDMTAALSQGGLVAAQMGWSIEETTGTLAAFASAGLVGSDAGTSMKTMLLRLAHPVGDAAKKVKELGLNLYDANGQFVSAQDLAGQLQDKLSGLSAKQRNAALATIFGSDAIRSASILYRQGAKGIGDWTDKVNDQGYAAETAAIKLDNLAGDFERLGGSLETAFIGAGSGAQAGLRDLVQGAERLVNKFSELPDGMQRATVKWAAYIAGAGAALFVVGKIATAVSAIKATAGMFGLAKAASAGGAVASAVGGGVQKVFVVNWAAGAAGGAVGAGASASGAAAAGGAGGAAASQVGKTSGFLSKLVKNPLMKKAGWLGLILSVASAGKTFTDAEDKSNGFIDVLQDIAGETSTTGRRLQNTQDAMNKVSADERAAAIETKGLAAAFITVGAAFQLAGAQMRSLPAEVQTKISAPGALETVQDVRDLALLYNLTPKQVQTVMELKGFSETKQRIVAAGQAYTSLPKNVRTKVETPGALNSLADVQRLAKQYNLTPKQVRTLMAVTGTAKAQGQVKGLKDEIARVKSKIVNMSEKGAAAARARIAAMRAEIARLQNKTVTTTLITQRINRGASGNVGGGAAADAQAEGGTVGGQRQPYGDKVLTYLAPGEEVISNRYGQADRYREILRAINANAYASGGTVQRFARGGTVRNDGASPAMTRLTKALNALKGSVDKQTAARDAIASKRSELAGGVTDKFRTDLFGESNAWAAGGGAGGAIATLKADIAKANTFKSLLGALSKKGLDGDALAELAGTGDVGKAQAFASMSKKDLGTYESLYNQRATASAGVGAYAGMAAYSVQQAAAQAQLVKLNGQVAALNRQIKGLRGDGKGHAKNTGREVAKGVNSATGPARRHKKGKVG